MTIALDLPRGLPATGPPEARGIKRDEVRLLVADPFRITHTRFHLLGEFLEPGDVLVVNTSATRAAAADGTWQGRAVTVHFSNRLGPGRWIVEVRQADGAGPVLDAAAGERIEFGGASVTLEVPVVPTTPVRLWRAATSPGIEAYLEIHGRAISYGYSAGSWPLRMYQTVFSRADDPSGASAEMPSAGRPFTTEMVTGLITGGISVVPITLHTGVSSLERHETPPPEWYTVPVATADAVTAAQRRGGRVVAVGTTVTRALESVADRSGTVRPGTGWTNLVMGPERQARAVNGLVTGWHPPEASHIRLLEAVAGADLISRAYHEAADHGYLWHEFGDAALFLPTD